MPGFRLSLIGLFIVAGVVGCAEDDPWVGKWKVVVDIDAEIAKHTEYLKGLVEAQEPMQKRFEERSAGMTAEERIEFKEKTWGGDAPRRAHRY